MLRFRPTRRTQRRFLRSFRWRCGISFPPKLPARNRFPPSTLYSHLNACAAPTTSSLETFSLTMQSTPPAKARFRTLPSSGKPCRMKREGSSSWWLKRTRNDIKTIWNCIPPSSRNTGLNRCCQKEVEVETDSNIQTSRHFCTIAWIMRRPANWRAFSSYWTFVFYKIVTTQNDNIDITLAFVESVIQSLREPGVGAPIISADGQEEAPPRESKNELVFKCYEIGCGKEFRSLRNLVQHRLTHQGRFCNRMKR